MTKIIYNQVKPSDIDAIMHIETTDFAENEVLSKASMMERIELISDTFIVARTTDETVIGYITGPVTEGRYLSDICFEHSESNPKSGGFQKVISLAINPEYQGLGIATALLQQLENEARIKTREGLSLTCHDYLIPYYEKHGFTNEGLSESKLGGEIWYNMVMEF